MKTINFVMGYRLSNYFKTSKHMKSDLGFSYTEENQKTGDRTLSRSDKFALSYNHTYNASLMKFGSMGNIDFYIDTGINAPHVAVYYELEEFVINWDENYYKTSGIDGYIGRILKMVESGYSDRKTPINREQVTNNVIQASDIISEEQKPDVIVGNADILKTNPGQARYEDIIAHVRKKSTK